MSLIKKVDKKIKYFKDLNENIETIVVEILLKYETEIVDMNSEDQLYTQGVDADNVKIADREPYSPYTIQVKRIKGQPINRVSTRDEGDFHKNFYLKKGDKKVSVWSRDEKTSDLVQKYGDSIFGLIPDNEDEIRTYYVRPEIIELLKKT